MKNLSKTKITFWIAINFLLIISLISLVQCALPDSANPKIGEKPHNIIFLIGDGMGLTHVTATRIKTVGPDGTLSMDTFPFTGFVKTHSANNLITDSAASGTAMSTGYKTDNGKICVTPDSLKIQTIVEACQEHGLKTGLIATSSITHATPASMASHVHSRGNQQLIAEQLIENKVNILFGGGLGYFMPKSDKGSLRKDEKNVLDFSQRLGYSVVKNAEQLNTANAGYLLGLFALEAMTCEAPEPTLAEMTKKAITALSQSGKGFFLMVEGSQIDWEAHDNDAEGVFEQTEQFDEAVNVAINFARENGETLVIVTADHETGGMTINGGRLTGEDVKIAWTTGGHTGTMVPLFAFGPGAERFTGVYDNTQIPKIYAELLGIDDFPKVLARNYQL